MGIRVQIPRIHLKASQLGGPPVFELVRVASHLDLCRLKCWTAGSGCAHGTFTWVLEIQTLVLGLVWQMLYPLAISSVLLKLSVLMWNFGLVFVVGESPLSYSHKPSLTCHLRK